MTHFFRPSARIEIAGDNLSAAEAGLQAVQVTRGLDAHSSARLSLWAGSRFSAAAPGDPVTVQLGSSDDETAVLTGTVTGAAAVTGALLLDAEDASGQLSRLRTTEVYEEMNLRDVAASLTGLADIGLNAESGPLLPVYYVDPRRTVWDHVIALAHLGGARVIADGNGGLVFGGTGGGASHTLRHGAELLDWSLTRQTAPGGFGAGPHGDSGSGAWHWIAPDPLGDTPDPTVIHGVLSDRDGADGASEGSAARAALAGVHGRITISGSPEIQPGDAVTLEDLPVGDPGPLTVRGVRHSLDGRLGFLTVLTLGAGSGGGVGGVLP